MSSIYLSSGVSSGGAVGSGTVLYVLGSGRTVFTSVGSGGLEFVSAGGAASAGVVASGGLLVVASGGAASGTTIAAGGAEIVRHGAVQSGAVIFAGGEVTDFGYEAYATVSAGGVLSVGQHGFESEAQVASGGFLEVASGGTAYANVASGGVVALLASGSAAGTVQGGGVVIAAGGAADGLALLSGATTITSGIVVMSGPGDPPGFMDFTETINLTGLADALFILSGGYVGSMHVADGAVAEICAGGSAGSATVGTDGVLNIYAGGTVGTVLLDGTEALSGGTAFGTTIGSGGEQVVDRGGVASDSTIAGGILDLDDGVVSGAVFFSGGGTLEIVQSAMPGAVISGFNFDDRIVLEAPAFSAGASYSVTAPGVLMISAGSTSYALNIAGATADTPFDLTLESGDLVLTAPCFGFGTSILTPEGGVAVERLRVGHRVITRGGGDAAIVWIGRRRLDLRGHPEPEIVQPIRIGADAFGDGVPARDLVLSPDHAVFFDGALIPAKALVNGRNVVRLPAASVAYYHVELAEHAVIFAEALAVESYLETGNRGAFENGGGAVTLHPDFAQRLRESRSCAPFAETGPAVAAAARLLMERFYASAPYPAARAFSGLARIRRSKSSAARGLLMK